MKAEVLHQTTSQDVSTNAINRNWVILKIIPCQVIPIKETGSTSTSDNKTFSKEYSEELQTKIYTLDPLSKRWRVSNIKNNSDVSIYQEIDRVSSPPTIFEVYGSHPVLDIFGNVQYYESHLRRVQVQSND